MKRFLSLVLALIMCASSVIITASAADEVKEVSNMKDFIEAMKASGTATIKLKRKVECYHKIGAEKHEPIVVNGNKTIDLNGYELGCKDHTNAEEHDVGGFFGISENHYWTDCYSTTGNKNTFIKVAKGATLTIGDSQSSPGMLFFHGKTVGSTFEKYTDRAHFDGFTRRDLFEVDGTLIINGGIYQPGYEEERYFSNGVNLDNYDSSWPHFYNNGVEQIFGSTAVVNNGGKLVVNGGILYGKGIEASLKAGTEHIGSYLDANTWVDIGTDELSNLLGGEDYTETVVIRSRDEVIEVKGGNVEINGGTIHARNGANIFGGTPSGKVKVTAGRFETSTADYLRVIDDEFHPGKFYGTVINGRRGDIGLKTEYLADINTAFVAYLGETYDTPITIKAKDFEKVSEVVVVGKKKDPAIELDFTAVSPARKISEDGKTILDQGHYPAYINDKIDFSFDVASLTEEQKASGYTLTKKYTIRNVDPNAAPTNISNSSTADGAYKFSHTFTKAGWYDVIITATVANKEGEKLGSAGYTYHYYATPKILKLKVSKMPAKTSYTAGEKIDTTGIALEATYSDGTTQDVTPFTWKVAQDEAVKPGQEYYAIEYTRDSGADMIEKVTVHVPITVTEPKTEAPEITIDNKFTDVDTGTWYFNYVLLAVQAGLVNGKSENEYKPDDNLTYAEAVKLAACMHQLYTKGEITLKNGDPWYQSYVDYCKTNGIINKDYAYGDFATRAGYMQIFANALPAEALDPINDVPDGSIPDVPMGLEYSDAVYKLYRAGILQGSDEQHSCKPNDNIKRAEVATILIRMMYDATRISFSMANETAKPLSIKTQPGTKTAAPGATAKFIVIVEGGKAPYTYQWKQKVNGRETNVAGETSATTIMTAPESGSVSRFCEITDAEGNKVTSEPASLSAKTSSGGPKDKFEQVDAVELKLDDFILKVEDVFVITTVNTIVVTGKVEDGKLNIGDPVCIFDLNGDFVAETKVTRIEMFKKLLNECEKGDSVGLGFDLDVETWREKIKRGFYVLGGESIFDD